MPIGAMFAMTLWLGNTAYLYISVSFAQMLKAVSKYSNFEKEVQVKMFITDTSNKSPNPHNYFP